jgi:hypothetical protein
MLDRLQSFIYSAVKLKNVLILLAAFIFMNAVVMREAGARLEAQSGGVGPFDLMLSYSPDTAQSMLEAYGDQGRRIYTAIELTADLVYPLVFGSLFSLAIAACLRPTTGAKSRLRRLAMLPLAASAADYLENIGIVTLLQTFPNHSSTVVQLTSLATSAKWLLFALGMAVLIAAAAAAIARRLRGPRQAAIG